MPRPRRPLAEVVRSGTTWWRIHRADRGALYFGPPPGQPPRSRFDAPGGEYRIGYFGTTRDASFAEVFLRVPPVELITMDEVEARRLTAIEVVRDVRVARLVGRGLARAGITASATTGAEYGVARAAALAIWSHSDGFDGLLYRARHDDDELSVALFDRAADAVAPGPPQRLTDDVGWLATLPVRYGFDFDPSGA